MTGSADIEWCVVLAVSVAACSEKRHCSNPSLHAACRHIMVMITYKPGWKCTANGVYWCGNCRATGNNERTAQSCCQWAPPSRWSSRISSSIHCPEDVPPWKYRQFWGSSPWFAAHSRSRKTFQIVYKKNRNKRENVNYSAQWHKISTKQSSMQNIQTYNTYIIGTQGDAVSSM